MIAGAGAAACLDLRLGNQANWRRADIDVAVISSCRRCGRMSRKVTMVVHVQRWTEIDRQAPPFSGAAAGFDDTDYA
jgi:hypothetical protein